MFAISLDMNRLISGVLTSPFSASDPCLFPVCGMSPIPKWCNQRSQRCSDHHCHSLTLTAQHPTLEVTSDERWGGQTGGFKMPMPQCRERHGYAGAVSRRLASCGKEHWTMPRANEQTFPGVTLRRPLRSLGRSCILRSGFTSNLISPKLCAFIVYPWI